MTTRSPVASHQSPVETVTLVTGAGGFAGSHVLDQLADDDSGSTLVAWHRPGSAPGPRSASDRVRWEAVDLLDRAAVAAAVARARPSIVFHCAGAAHEGRARSHTEAAFAINVRGTQFVLDALDHLHKEHGVVARVLIPSSAMVYRLSTGPHREDDELLPPNPYGLSKLAQEMLAARAARDGVAVCIARAFNHVGPRQDPSFVVSDFARQIAVIESACARIRRGCARTTFPCSSAIRPASAKSSGGSRPFRSIARSTM